MTRWNAACCTHSTLQQNKPVNQPQFFFLIIQYVYNTICISLTCKYDDVDLSLQLEQFVICWIPLILALIAFCNISSNEHHPIRNNRSLLALIIYATSIIHKNIASQTHVSNIALYYTIYFVRKRVNGPMRDVLELNVWSVCVQFYKDKAFILCS